MKGVSFDWEENLPQLDVIPANQQYIMRKRSIGFIAQDIEKIFPEVIWEDNFGYKTLQYDVLVAVGVGAVKENQLRIENLKNNLTNLKDILNA
jgi:hypothetical protein